MYLPANTSDRPIQQPETGYALTGIFASLAVALAGAARSGNFVDVFLLCWLPHVAVIVMMFRIKARFAVIGGAAAALALWAEMAVVLFPPAGASDWVMYVVLYMPCLAAGAVMASRLPQLQLPRAAWSAAALSCAMVAVIGASPLLVFSALTSLVTHMQ